MNGQTARLEIARAIIEKCEVEQMSSRQARFAEQQLNGLRSSVFPFSVPRFARDMRRLRSAVWRIDPTFRLIVPIQLRR